MFRHTPYVLVLLAVAASVLKSIEWFRTKLKEKTKTTELESAMLLILSMQKRKELRP